MPEITISHAGITDDEAKKPPKRDVVPPGEYSVVIMAAKFGATKGTPPIPKLAVEFQIIDRLLEDGKKEDDLRKRRVYQDFILKSTGEYPDLDARRRHELRMLLDNTDTPFTEVGFNSDHLIAKTVRITIRHRLGDLDDDGQPRIFTNVTKIDTLEEVNEDDLV